MLKNMLGRWNIDLLKSEMPPCCGHVDCVLCPIRIGFFFKSSPYNLRLDICHLDRYLIGFIAKFNQVKTKYQGMPLSNLMLSSKKEFKTSCRTSLNFERNCVPIKIERMVRYFNKCCVHANYGSVLLGYLTTLKTRTNCFVLRLNVTK